MADTRTIELDATTAEEIEMRAAKRGVSAGELVAELLAEQANELADLEERWAAVERGEPTVPHDRVARWLETWGTAKFEPWPKR